MLNGHFSRYLRFHSKGQRQLKNLSSEPKNPFRVGKLNTNGPFPNHRERDNAISTDGNGFLKRTLASVVKLVSRVKTGVLNCLFWVLGRKKNDYATKTISRGFFLHRELWMQSCHKQLFTTGRFPGKGEIFPWLKNVSRKFHSRNIERKVLHQGSCREIDFLEHIRLEVRFICYSFLSFLLWRHLLPIFLAPPLARPFSYRVDSWVKSESNRKLEWINYNDRRFSWDDA